MFRKVERIPMSLLDWSRLPDNPRQRDTAARMKRATHLDTFDDTHMHVVACTVGDDPSLIKVDGHTRNAKWQAGQTKGLPPDLELIVDVYACDTMADVPVLHERYDSKAAAETTPEAISGYMRQHGIHLQSKVVKGASARSFAYNILKAGQKGWPENSHSLAFAVLKPVMRPFDEICPSPRRFTTATAAAAYISMLAYPNIGAEFWLKHQNGEGVKKGKACDPVQLADNLVTACFKRGIHSSNDINKQIRQYLTVFARYVRDETFLAKSLTKNDSFVDSILKLARHKVAQNFPAGVRPKAA